MWFRRKLLSAILAGAAMPAVLMHAAIALPGWTPAAIAQTRAQPRNIFEALFPNLFEERLRRERALLPSRPAIVTKVEAPKYYSYKVDRLVRLKLEAVSAMPEIAAGDSNEIPSFRQSTGDELIAQVSSALAGDQAIAKSFSSLAAVLDQLPVHAEPEIAAALASHYQARPVSLWLDAQLEPTLRARSALLILGAANQYGLEPEDYLVQLPAFSVPASPAERLAAAARFEFMLSARAVRYALDAANGRIMPNRLSGYHDFPAQTLTAEAAFEAIASGPPYQVLNGFHPANAQFKALFDELERLNGEAHETNLIAEDVLIKPGQASEELPAIIAAIARLASNELKAKYPALLVPQAFNATPGTSKFDGAIERATLADAKDTATAQASIIRQDLPAISAKAELWDMASGAGAAAPAIVPPAVAASLPSVRQALTYTPQLVELVKAYQAEAGLGADGVIGRNTIAKLSGVSNAVKRQRVIIALEQLRWHPDDLGNRHVFINQPAFRARYVENGKTQIDMRVIVGTKANQTSFFHDVIETVEYNPYWGVPRSILVNEFLPKLRQNPSYLDERGYEVSDGKGNRIASSSIDWWAVGANPQYDVRQSPGEANALGELKILFPNKHAIYMHDTPARELFNKDFRALSHGCVRLAEPRVMAAAVLGKTVADVEEMLGKGHGQDELASKFPVYVAYFTAWPKDDGTVEYFADMYGRDEAVNKAFAAVRAVRGAAG